MRAGGYLLNLGGAEPLVDTTSTLAVVNTRVQNNTMFRVTDSLLSTSQQPADNSSGGAIWLQGSLLSDNNVVLPMKALNGSRGFYSDVPREYYSQEEGALVATAGPPPPALREQFLSRAGWLKNISEARPAHISMPRTRGMVNKALARQSKNLYSRVCFHMTPHISATELRSLKVNSWGLEHALGVFFFQLNVFATVQALPGVELQAVARDQPALDATVKTVATAAALQKAVQGGARHIRITQHLDLRALPLSNELVLGAVSSTTFTIQVLPFTPLAESELL
jgi:hypothetical protein